MRGRAIATTAMTLLVAFVAPAILRAQAVFQVEGGGSTVGSGYGSRVQFWSGDYEGWIGAGFSRGWRLGMFAKHQLGAGIDTLRAGFDVQPIGFSTDLFSGGSYVLTQGAAWRRKRGALDATLFAGATGAGIGAPFVNSARADKPLGMLRAAWRPSPAWVLETHAVGARRQTLLETGAWTSEDRVHTVAATGGVGANKPFGAVTWRANGEYGDVRLGYTAFARGFHRADAPLPNLAEPFRENALVTLKLPRRAMLTLGHQNFRQEDTTAATASRAQVDQATANVSVFGTSLGGGVFQTTSEVGRTLSTFNSIGRGLPFGTSGTVLLFQTFNKGTAPIRTVQAELREPISHTLSLSQVFARTGTSVSGGVGGRYQRGFTTIAFDYQNYYVPLRQPNPFMRALNLTVRLQLWNASASVGTALDPFGHLSYTAMGSTYIYVGEMATGVQPIPLRLERYLIKGTVEDEHGVPIDGAALDVGGDITTTNSRGEFFVRTKSQRAVPLRVSFDDFLSVGNYEVLIAPAEVQPEDEAHARPVRIVLRGVAGRAGPKQSAPVSRLVSQPAGSKPATKPLGAAAATLLRPAGAKPVRAITPTPPGTPSPAASLVPLPTQPAPAPALLAAVTGLQCQGIDVMLRKVYLTATNGGALAQKPAARRKRDKWGIIERPLPYTRY